MKSRKTVAGFLHSRTQMYRAGWALFIVSLPWGWAVLGFVVWGNRDFPQDVSPGRFVGLMILTLALFSNFVLFAARSIRRSSGPLTSWRSLLFAFLALNVSVVFFLPGLARVPGYWLWLLGFGAVSWSLTMMPHEAEAPSSHDRSTPVSDDVPELVWAFLGVTIFWLGVTIVNYYQFHHRRPTRPPSPWRRSRQR